MAVYLDHNATTPPDPRVNHAMGPWLAERFGNGSSRDHSWGWDAADAVEQARWLVANGANARICFVSGATEALATVIRSYVGFERWSEKRIVTSATEHDAVLESCRYVRARAGVTVEVLPVDRLGHLDLDLLRGTVRKSAGALVAIMAANNEVGTLHPVREIARIVADADSMFLCDSTQAFGRSPFDGCADGVDFHTVSAHKIHGPKGAGALIARQTTTTLDPLIHGGGQERGARGGTLNVAGIVGLGEACRILHEEKDMDIARMARLRDRLEAQLLAQVDDAWVNGDPASRLCNTSNIGFKGVDARTVIRNMGDVAVSTRAACSTGDRGPSHVLKAIGLSDDDAYASIRFSLGRFTTEREIDYAVGKVVASVHTLRRTKGVRV